MNFFLDNTFSPKLARALGTMAEAEEHVVVHLLEKYNEDPGDLVWIPDVGNWPEQWIVLSGDRKIRTNPQRRAALAASSRTAFFMPSGFPDLRGWEQAWRLFKWFPDIAKKGAHTKGQRLYEVRMNGAIDLVP